MASGSSARVKAERETPPRGEDERRPLRSSNTSSTATGPLRRAPFRDAGKENHAVAEDTADDSHRRRRTEIEIDDTDDVNADFLRASGCPAPYYPSIDARSRRPSALDLRGRAQEMHEVGGTEQEDLDILRAYRNPASHYPSRLPCAVVLRRRRDVVKADDVEVLGALLSRRRRQPYPGARRQDYRELRVRTGDAHHLRAEREEDDYGTLSETVTAERCARAVEAPAEVCYAPRNKAGQGTVSHNIVRVDRHRAASTSKWSLVAALRRICAITHSDATEPHRRAPAPAAAAGQDILLEEELAPDLEAQNERPLSVVEQQGSVHRGNGRSDGAPPGSGGGDGGGQPLPGKAALGGGGGPPPDQYPKLFGHISFSYQMRDSETNEKGREWHSGHATAFSWGQLMLLALLALGLMASTAAVSRPRLRKIAAFSARTASILAVFLLMVVLSKPVG